PPRRLPTAGRPAAAAGGPTYAEGHSIPAEAACLVLTAPSLSRPGITPSRRRGWVLSHTALPGHPSRRAGPVLPCVGNVVWADSRPGFALSLTCPPDWYATSPTRDGTEPRCVMCVAQPNILVRLSRFRRYAPGGRGS